MAASPAAVLFDLDGTLIDSHDVILASMRHAVNGVGGLGLSDGELMHMVGLPLIDQMKVFSGGDEALCDRLMKAYRAHNDAHHDQMLRGFPGAAEALSRLRAMGLRLGVVTSKRHEPAVAGLALCGIDGFFEAVVGPDDWPEHKPAPGPVLHGCALVGVEPSRCMYVGDSPYDLQAGRAAGCATAAALWGMFSREELAAERPDVMCGSLGELAALLEAEGRADG